MNCGTLDELAAAVAQRLPSGWDHAADPMQPGVVAGPDGMWIVLSPSSFGGREIRGVLPVETSAADIPDSLRSRCRIRVASAHEPDALASAIKHRLFPAYLPLFDQLTSRGAGPNGSPAIVDSAPTVELEPVAGDRVRVTVVVPREFVPRVRAALAALAS